MRETAKDPGLVPPVLYLLEDADVEERGTPGIAVSAWAAEIAGGGDVRDADRRATALRARWAGTSGPAARLGVLLAIGEFARGCSAAVLPEILIWLRGLRDAGDDPHVRLAAAMALAHAVEAERAETARDHLAEAADVEVWRDVPWVGAMPDELVGVLGGTGAALVRWVGDALGVADRADLCSALAGHPDGDRRTGAVHVAAKLIARWRSPAVPLLPALAAWTRDPLVAVREYSTHILAALGEHADVLADRLDDHAALFPQLGYHIGDIAAWGLARQDDPRCVPHLVERLGGPELDRVLGSAESLSTKWLSSRRPGLGEALVLMRAHAGTFLPLIRARLTDCAPRAAAALLRVLEEWRDDAADALPEIMPLLETELHGAAVDALAATGAADAVPALERLARRPPDGLPAWAPGLSRLRDARAYWRLTGDPEHYLAALEAAFRPEHVQAQWRYFADLGPHAAAFAGRLRPLLRHRDVLKRVAAAYSLFRITGDPDEVRHVLWEAVHPIATRSHNSVTWSALHHLTEMGPAKPRMRPVLEDLLASDRRHCNNGGVEAIDEDAALREYAATLLAN
ncbi:hypothetical protein GCM10010191_78330 [Actinomadura vinacea]|uniref:HEAT repeat domain-containing protein n=1 Tax=Actinomadura vinacea TaxID=115336 RepID=A0ABN3K4D9_9ACTN